MRQNLKLYRIVILTFIILIIPNTQAIVPATPEITYTQDNTNTQTSITTTSTHTITYKQGYYSINGNQWTPFSIQGNQLNNNWIQPTATGNIEIPRTNDNQNIYVILFACNQAQNTWDCQENQWQLLQTTIPSNNQQTQGNGLEGIFSQGNDGMNDFSGTITNTYTNQPLQLTLNGHGGAYLKGEIEIPTNGAYEFRIISSSREDEGYKLEINQQTIIDEWYRHGPTIREETIQLTQGPTPIRFQLFNIYGDAQAQVTWKQPGTNNFEIIPITTLYSANNIQSPPTIEIETPTNGREYHPGEHIQIKAQATHPTAQIQKVEFKVDGITIHEDYSKPYQYTTNTISEGTHTLQATAHLTSGTTAATTRTFSITNQNIPNPEGRLLWSNPNTWQSIGTTIPETGDDVTIPAGTNILLDISPPPLQEITVQGSIKFAEKDLDLTADAIRVMGEGAELIIGTEEQPFNHKATITLTGTEQEILQAEDARTMCGYKVLCSMNGGRLELIGEYEGPTWTKLENGATVRTGDTTIDLSESVNWKEGEEIVITATGYDPGLAEKRTIASVSQQGKRLHFSEPFKFEHYGAIQCFSGYCIDQRAEVMHLTRSIKIQGDKESEETLLGGHIMAMNEHASQQFPKVFNQGQQWTNLWQEDENNPELMPKIDAVELKRMGQSGILARYPWHWHMYGDATGSYVRNSAVHESYQRCHVIHGTQNALLENNVAFNALNSCYFLEDGVEWDNTLRNNIGALVQPAPDPTKELIESDRRPAVFYWVHPMNHFENNVAAGAYGYGFHHVVRTYPRGLAENSNLELNRNVEIGTFKNNIAHSNARTNRHPDSRVTNDHPGSGFGLFVDAEEIESGIGINCPNPQWNPDACLYENFTAWYNEFYGSWFDNGRSGARTIHSTYADNGVDFWNIIIASHDNTYIDRTENRGNPGKSGQGYVENVFYDPKVRNLVLEFEREHDQAAPWRFEGEDMFTGQSTSGVRMIRDPQTNNYVGVEKIVSIGQQPHYDGMFFRDNVFINFHDDETYDSGVVRFAENERVADSVNNLMINSDQPYHSWKYPSHPDGELFPNDKYQYTTLHDWDGSLTGTGRYTEVREAVVGPGSGYDWFYDDTCTPYQDEYHVCFGKSIFQQTNPVQSYIVEETGEEIRQIRGHFPVNKTYRAVQNVDQVSFFMDSVSTGDWIMYKFPSERPFVVSSTAQTPANEIVTVPSRSELEASSASATLYYDAGEQMQYVKYADDWGLWLQDPSMHDPATRPSRTPRVEMGSATEISRFNIAKT